MKLTFDIRGYLKPYTKNKLVLKEFKEFFVTPFSTSSSRHEIFTNFEKYIQDFKNEICPEFKQLVNGSFVTNKQNPNDIDIVTLVDYKTVDAKKALIKSKFINKTALQNYQIDTYIIRVYPKNHNKYNEYISDLLYWQHWFGYSKKNRNRKRFPKGFVELHF